MARTLFARMKGDVNRFVDDVYAPYQIQFVKVHEAQDEVLKKADLEGLREKVGVKLSNASSRRTCRPDARRSSASTRKSSIS